MSEPTTYTSTSTLNAKKDYFRFVSTIGNTKIKCTGSAENRSTQQTSGPNTFGDPVVLDVFAETASPSAEYEVIGALSGQAITLGTIIAADAQDTPHIKIGGVAVPVCLGSLSISTQTGSAPKISLSGLALYAGAAQLRSYSIPAITLSPRHRAQDIFANPLWTIKYNSSSPALPTFDYGLSGVNANFPIEFTQAMPGGTLLGYDLHGGVATVDCTFNWYRTDYPPEVAINTAAFAGSIIPISVGADASFSSPLAMTTPPNGSDADGQYTQYSFQISFPLVGVEVS